MRIQEVEKLVGISKKNIRFYEEQGLLRPDREPGNGYRTYTEAHVEQLQKIWLLRKLAVPLEEIRRMQNGTITLEDCLNRHAILLNREIHNLEQTQLLCHEIAASHARLDMLDVEAYQKRIKEMEEGDTHFMNPEKDKRKKKVAPLIAALVFTVFFGAMIAMVIWGAMVDPIPIGFVILFVAIFAAMIVGLILALLQRLKEIEGGEADEARNY